MERFVSNPFRNAANRLENPNLRRWKKNAPSFAGENFASVERHAHLRKPGLRNSPHLVLAHTRSPLPTDKLVWQRFVFRFCQNVQIDSKKLSNAFLRLLTTFCRKIYVSGTNSTIFYKFPYGRVLNFKDQFPYGRVPVVR